MRALGLLACVLEIHCGRQNLTLSRQGPAAPLASAPSALHALATRLDQRFVASDAAAPSPLSQIGAAGGVDFVSCRLKLKDMDLDKLARNASLRISVSRHLADAVEKVAEDVPSHAVMTGFVADGHLDLGIALPEDAEAEDVLKKMASSFLEEASDALSEGCCEGASVTMDEDKCALLGSGSGEKKEKDAREEDEKGEEDEEEEEKEEKDEKKDKDEEKKDKDEEKKDEDEEKKDEDENDDDENVAKKDVKKKIVEKEEEHDEPKGGGEGGGGMELKNLFVTASAVGGVVGACFLISYM